MTTTYEHNTVLATGDYDVVGTRPVRPDGVDKVTGRAQYGADASLPGLVYAKMLRSPHAHANIRSIDTSRAEAFPGVLAVATAADFPGAAREATVDYGEGDRALWQLRSNSMAIDKVHYRGQPVAGVAAVNAHVAEEALALIDVDYEVLPHVLSVAEAMADDRPPPPRGPDDGAVRREDRPPQQRRHPLPAQAGRPRRGLREGRRHHREGVPHRHRPPGLHRAPQRHRALEPGRARDDLVQHPGPLRGAGRHRIHPRPGGLRREAGADGDRRRLRRQVRRLPRPGRRHPFQEDRTPRQDGDEQDGGVREHRADARLLRQDQDGRYQRGKDHRRPRRTSPTRPAPSPAPRSARAP